MDLSTTYLGLSLEHPVMPSASPLTEKLEGIERLADAGAPAIVMHSLFEEQINHESHTLDHFLSYGSESFAEALSYFPDLDSYRTGPDAYLELIRQAKERVDVPIIASLNGVSDGGWVEHARLMEEAGADALELNIYYIPTRPEMTGAEVEQMYVDVVRHVRRTVSIPVAVKVGPFFSAFANMARRFHEAGADGLVLFNRFYQPDFDLEALDVVPRLNLSTSADLLLPLQWVAILYGRVPVDLALSGGVHTHEDALKGLMAGANVVMMTAELLKRGVQRIGEIVADMKQWMEEHEYESVAQMRGSMSQQHVANPDAFERANYMKTLRSWRPDPTGAWTG